MVNSIRTLLAAFSMAALLVAQDPLTVSEALSLKQVVNPQMGDGFVAFNVVAPRPVEDGPGGSYLHLGVVDGDGAVRMLVEGKRSAGSMAVRPGSAMRPSNSSSAMRARLRADQMPPGLRGENHCMVRSSSTGTTLLSIHPKHRASSRSSGWRGPSRGLLALR